MRAISLLKIFFSRVTNSDLYCYALLSIIVLIAHSNIIFLPSTMSPDAPYILLYMEELSSLKEYFQKLISLQGIDFQPVRDLSLWIDLKIFRETGINLFIINNCLIWSGCCFHVFQLSKFDAKKDHRLLLILVMCLSLHPVFSQTVNWSMGRKHLLACFFILWTCRKFLEMLMGNNNWKSVFTLYGLSLLSVPVSLLWPVWATITAYISKKEQFKKIFLRLIPFFFLLVTIGIINYIYYFTSETYKEIYIQKSGSIDYNLLFHHIGQHVKQILYPLPLRFHYRLDNSTLWFFGIVLLITLWLLKQYRKDRTLWIWFCFSIISMGLFLRTPETYFDTYVILPAIGFFLVMTRIINSTFSKMAGLIAIPVLMVLTLRSNPAWISLRNFSENNFHYNQDCPTARSLAESIFVEKKKLPNDLFEFIQRNNCLEAREGDSPVGTRGIRNLEARLLLIEDEIDLDYRKKRLSEIGEENYYPKIIYALLMSRLEDDVEIENAMVSLNKAFRTLKTPLDFDPIVTNELTQYCQKKALPECIQFTDRYAQLVKEPFL